MAEITILIVQFLITVWSTGELQILNSLVSLFQHFKHDRASQLTLLNPGVLILRKKVGGERHTPPRMVCPEAFCSAKNMYL